MQKPAKKTKTIQIKNIIKLYTDSPIKRMVRMVPLRLINKKPTQKVIPRVKNQNGENSFVYLKSSQLNESTIADTRKKSETSSRLNIFLKSNL
jgi:hypothetical protein